MSLFRLQEWWRTHQGDGMEEFDQSSMCVGNVDNSPRSTPKIVTGSFSGVLRIYQPLSSQFNPAHLLLESQLQEPILQVAMGHFSAGVPLSLALLHPRCLSIYQIAQPKVGADDITPFLEIHKQDSHHIPHTAANMVSGHFGGSNITESILVQAFDGQIYIFEGGQQVHLTFLEDFLVPGPMVYVSATDSFVTCSSSYELQSYSYSSIIQACQTKSEALAGTSAHDLNRRKAPCPQWSLVIGELAVDLQLAGASSPNAGEIDIVVVGEHTILICSQDGKLKSQRRLDYHPAAATSYM
jgi:Bardet-Biedl syndrome 9 protein